MLGFENTLLNMALDPDLIERMFSDITDFQLAMVSLLLTKGYVYDGIELRIDCASRNGLLFSEQYYRDLLLPHHQRICDFGSNMNLPVIIDNDGDMSALLSFHLQSGVRGLCICPGNCRTLWKLLIIHSLELFIISPESISQNP